VAVSTELIRATGVSRIFASEAEVVRAVDDVDMAAVSGEFICLFGHSGSGKTTLLNVMGGLDLPTSGTMLVDGQSLAELSEEGRIRMRRDTVGMVHQTDFLIEEFTAVENVALPLEARGMRASEACAEGSRLLARVDLEGYDARFPRQLSGGQRQRVGIARALTGGRRVLLADEPTGALDSTNSAAIFALLRGLSDEGTLVVVASHDPACRNYANRLVEMRDGRVEVDKQLC
jgi:ABC-type lipoprotein export system ATPase subunit